MAFAHRLRAASANRARPAALIILTGLADGLTTAMAVPLTLAQRARWAAAILALAAALIVRLRPGAGAAEAAFGAFQMLFNSFARTSIFSLMARACFNCCTDRSDAELVLIVFLYGFGQLKSSHLNTGLKLDLIRQ